MLCAAFFGVLAVLLIEEIIKDGNTFYFASIKIMHVLLLAFIYSTLLDIMRLHRKMDPKKYMLFVVIILLFSLGYYLVLPHYPQVIHGARTWGLFLIGHLLIAVLPFLRGEAKMNFYLVNRKLVLRFLESTLFSLFLFAALAIAILAIDKLFEVDLSDEIYLDTFLLIITIFHPLYFFSRFPVDYLSSNLDDTPDRAYTIFAHRILVPVSYLYALILFAYVVKIVVLWSWPQGWISNMVLWFAVVGLMTYLFNYDLINQRSPSYLKIFSRWLFPYTGIMSIVLLLAVYRRISEYGVTEPRFIVAITGVWLMFLSLYFVLSRQRDIRVLPISMIFVFLISLFGPVNMFISSLRSQLSRLEKSMIEGGYLVNGELQKNESNDPDADNAILGKIYFFRERDRLDLLKRWESANVNVDLKEADEESYSLEGPLIFMNRDTEETYQQLLKSLGLPAKRENQIIVNGDFYMHTPEKVDVTSTGALRIIQIDHFHANENDSLAPIRISADQKGILLNHMDTTYLISLDIQREDIRRSYEVDKLSFHHEAEEFELDLFLNNLAGTIDNREIKLVSINGIAVIRSK